MSRPEDEEETPSSDPGPGRGRLRSGSPTLSLLSHHSKDSPMFFSPASETIPVKMDASSQTPAPVEVRPRGHSHRARRKSSVTESEPKSPDQPDVPSEKHHSNDSPPSLPEAERSSSTADCVSLTDSHFSKDAFVDFKKEDSPAQPETADQPSHPSVKKRHSKDPTSLVEGESSSPSAGDSVSLADSNFSMGAFVDFTKETLQFHCDPKSFAEVSKDDKTNINSIMELLEKTLHELLSSELKKFRRVLTANCFKVDTENVDHLDEWEKPEDSILELTLHVLKQMKQEHLADSLKNRLLAPLCQCQMKSKLKIKFQNIVEGIEDARGTILLNKIYTELSIIEGEVKYTKEHEVTQIQMKPSRPITTLKSADIFSRPGRQKRVRTVLTKGVAGIGKTLLTQKFSLDWAEGITNHNIHFIFPFTFRELNLLRGDSISLYGLIGHFFTEKKGICRFEEFQCLFIFDGLDECRLELDFSKTESVTDVREKTSVEVLLVNIIRGTLLPSALIWITSRPAAASLIPAVCVDMVTEVQGFDDPQKEIYFRKKFKNEEQASKVLSHVKASPNAFYMCSIPVFSWITATVMDNILQTDEGRLPQTLTELYIHFLVVQAKVTNVKYEDKSGTDLHWSPERRNCIMLLSKLAFEQLLRGNFIFYESDLTDCGINITEASVYSGLFSQMFKEERGLYQDKIFSFVHLSVQEFLAALHVHVTFMDSGVNLLPEKQSVWSKLFGDRASVIQFYKTAVDKALESPNGHLDRFLRFLLGLSLECNQSLLRGLVRQLGSPQINKETGEHLKTRLDSGLSIEKNLTLLQCLNELKDSGLCDEVQAWLNSEKIPSVLSPAQWSALVSILLSLEEPEFDLAKYQPSETALLMLMPVVKQSSKALLSGCGLSDKACEALSSELSSLSLRELDLSNNLLKDSGLQLLCEGLKSSSCALHTLSLKQCGLSSTSCEALVSVLVSASNSLTELDLSNNDLLDSGVKILCSALKNPLCKLETLRLSGCQVTKSGCAFLVSALSSGASCLTELDLSYNHPGETEAKQLTALFRDPPKKLSLEHGGVERLRSDFSKYACHLTFDLNSANKKIKVSDNRRITVEQETQAYPDHSERFYYWKQVLCSEGLTGRKYWEVEVRGDVYIAVTYKSIKRRGTGEESCFGKNAQSWSLGSSEDQTLSVLHHNRRRSLRQKESDRIGVYLDWDSGLLSFYEVSPKQKTHLHTIKTRFTEEVYPAFRIKTKPVNSFVTLCKV